MFVKPGKGPDGEPLLVRGPNGRHLRPDGEEVPDSSFWHRRLRDGDVVVAPREKIGELIADGQDRAATFAGDQPAAPAVATKGDVP